jgi:hypothetical protein
MNDRKLLEQAQAGDEDAFGRLVEPHRRALYAHAYRMLGSASDADDAVQETMLSAWRGLARFEGRSSLRSWLYRIATNASLKIVERRPKRVLPIDYGPPGDPSAVLILRDVLGFSAREAPRCSTRRRLRSTVPCSAPIRPSTRACPRATSRRPCASPTTYGARSRGRSSSTRSTSSPWSATGLPRSPR